MMRSDREEHKYVHENILEENKKMIQQINEEKDNSNIQEILQ